MDSNLLLLARDDDSAIDAMRRVAGDRVVTARIADLTRPGWRYVGGRPDLAMALAGGREILARQCAAVLCRVPMVTADDLPDLHADDREYAAAETTAFLRAWLAQFEGIRCNEPTWMSLAGADWHPFQWRRLVARLGIPVTSALQTGEVATAVVAGDRVLGIDDARLIDYSRRIARETQSRLLSIHFVNEGEWKFQSADSCPALDAVSAAALLASVLPMHAGERSHPSSLRARSSEPCVAM